MFSILILTYNEEDNLPRCLDSVSWCKDVVVLDSFSSDATVDIARSAHCQVFQRKFDNFAGQRNFAIDQIDFKNSWVFHLDADEHFTHALRAECEEVAKQDEKSAYLVPSKMMLWNRWLKHAATYPVYQMRFHKLGEARFEQYGHGQRETGMKRGQGTLQTPYEHHSFGKGFAEWFDRHNRYSSQEAHETYENLQGASFRARNLLAKDSIIRRRAVKELAYRLPGRAFLRFVYMYLFKLGFLDGAPGLTYCLLNSVYEQMISLKVRELKIAKGDSAKPEGLLGRDGDGESTNTKLRL